MKRLLQVTGLVLLFLCTNCKTTQNLISEHKPEASFTIAFGSCNKHNVHNDLWDDVLATHPDVWIWGGDIVYADTDNAGKIAEMYHLQKKVEGYRTLTETIPVIGTWDDHDYGLNDGGSEFVSKKESQQVFLDFMGVPSDSPRRQQEGVYTSYDYSLPAGSVKILVLDTRYFRSPLTRSTEKGKRFMPGKYGEGTILGEAQWKWLEEELGASEADFTILVSSVQFLSNQHGFECWGNFPHEVDKLKGLVASSKAKGVIILSGDRHISEFSAERLPGVSYPLIDFTSSGLTHVYSSYSGEPNPYRIGEVIAKKSFGLLKLDLVKRTVVFEMIGNNSEILNTLTQQY